MSKNKGYWDGCAGDAAMAFTRLRPQPEIDQEAMRKEDRTTMTVQVEPSLSEEQIDSTLSSHAGKENGQVQCPPGGRDFLVQLEGDCRREADNMLA